jgi:hypothetical protein
MQQAVAAIICACEHLGIPRFVLQSGITSSDGAELSAPNRWALPAIRRCCAAEVNNKRAEHLVIASDLDWVIVRPGGLRRAARPRSVVAGPRA